MVHLHLGAFGRKGGERRLDAGPDLARQGQGRVVDPQAETELRQLGMARGEQRHGIVPRRRESEQDVQQQLEVIDRARDRPEYVDVDVDASPPGRLR
jgi:hypothetical protein